MEKEKTGAKARTQSYIGDALISLMKERDYADITICELCEKAGVSRSTFYRSFTDKESVMASYLDRTISEFIAVKGPVPDDENDMYNYIFSILGNTYKYKEIIKSMWSSSLCFTLLNILSNVFVRSFPDRETTKNLYSKYPLLPYAYSGMLYNIMLRWVLEDCKESIAEVADTLFLAIYGHEHRRI
ncbi:MAG: TetR family transcriptional regulator [Clostridia bacterium]|nr:TetR family transcriptional regulator [Clostridia bacterium]